MSDADQAFEEARREIRLASRSSARYLDLNMPDLTRLPAEIGDLIELRGLDISNTKVADLSPIQWLTTLSELKANNTPVSDLAPLAGFSGLSKLELHHTWVSDLTPLRGFTSLVLLWLVGTNVRDISALADLPSLVELSLGNTPVASLAPARQIPSLKYLYLGGTNVEDWSDLVHLATLEALSLQDSNFAQAELLQRLGSLRSLNIARTPVADLRPLKDLQGLVEGAPEDEPPGGLHFEGCRACELDPEGLGRLAVIEDDVERTTKTLEYLRSLTDWPPPPLEAPLQDDVLRVVRNAEGKLDVAPTHPGLEEAAERLKQKLYHRLRAAFGELERTAGNQQPEVSRRARRTLERLPEDFTEADLVEVYLEVDWARGEFERRGEREGEERFSHAAIAALDKIVTIGPGLVLDNAEVEKLEERQRRFAHDPLPSEVVASQDALAGTIAWEPKAFGETLRRYAAASRSPSQDPTDRRGVVQRVMTRNTVVAIGRWIANETAKKAYHAALVAAAVWAWNNQALILTVASSWGDMFQAWLGPVLEQARAIAASTQAAGGIRPDPRR